MIRPGMLLIALAMTVCLNSVEAHDYTHGGLHIAHPWSRPTPEGVHVGSGYLVIRNRGQSPDRLVSASSPMAGKVEIHQTAIKSGVATMGKIENGVVVAPGKSVEFKPLGLHLMFFDLKRPLKQGELFPATLVFEKAGAVDVEFKVEAMRKIEQEKHTH